MAFAVTSPLTVTTKQAADNEGWAWAVYSGDMLLAQSQATFATKARASEAGRIALLSIRHNLHRRHRSRASV